MIPLPIDSIRPQLDKLLLSNNNFVLTAPTGSGKSTRVPGWMLDACPEGEIYVLQPRRLPARMLAKRVASERGTQLGQEVGYQIRFDAQRSAQTRLIYVTEGLLLRKLLDPKGMQQVAAILFDEFHERHLEGDLALALAKKLQETSHTKLKIGVLSATIDPEPICKYLNDAPHIHGEGRTYPVDIHYLGGNANDFLPDRIVEALKRSIQAGAEPNILVFLPGRFEILKVREMISSASFFKPYEILALYGDLPPEEQDRVMADIDLPRIILSTNIAETSITVPGLRTVIDSGVARIPDFDPRRGINSLTVEKISRASADQRAGRAGRLAAGNAFRLWTEKEHTFRHASTPPEIARLDLSEVLLQIYHAGFDAETFPWFEKPPEESLNRGLMLLRDLGAVKHGKISNWGSQMARFPLNPRYSRLLLAAKELNCLIPIIEIIAIAQSKSPLSRDGTFWKSLDREIAESLQKSDFLVQLYAYQLAVKEHFNMGWCRQNGIHAQNCRSIQRVSQQLLRIAQKEGLLDKNSQQRSESRIPECLLFGFSDQIAKRSDRGTLHCRLAHGRSGLIARDSVVDQSELLVSAELEEREFRGEVTTFLQNNTAIQTEWLKEHFPDEFEMKSQTRLDPDARRVEAVEQIQFRGLVLEESASSEPDPAEAASTLAKAVQSEGWILKKWNKKVDDWILRLNVLAEYCPELELNPITEEDRAFLIEQLCEGATRYKEIKDRDPLPIVLQWLPDNLHPLFDDYVPERFKLKSGASVKLRYEPDGTVVLPARIQQLYDTPGDSLAICQGRCPLKIEILAPNHRPVQITDDLDAFWQTSYPQIKKDLFGRYPKHEWR